MSFVIGQYLQVHADDAPIVQLRGPNPLPKTSSPYPADRGHWQEDPGEFSFQPLLWLFGVEMKLENLHIFISLNACVLADADL